MSMDLSRLTGRNFIAIGRAGMDLNTLTDETIESSTSFQPSLGGSTANICAALAKHGMKVAIATSVSDDAIGRFTVAQLQHFNVDTQYVKYVDGQARTSLAMVETRNEDQQCIIYRNNAADLMVTIEEMESIDFSQYSGVIATGTALAAEPSRSATLRAFELAREAKIPVILDLDYRPYSWDSAEQATETYNRAVAFCDIVVGNDVEFGFLAGDYDKGMECARQLVENKAQITVYKMGPKGSCTFTQGAEFVTGIYKVEPIKPTGAGDAFLGGFLAALADQFPLDESIKRGSACASIVVTRPSCAPAMPTPIELEQFMASHLGPTNNFED
jgi:5-dehydro-2-deoxygluconokinase